MAKKSKSEKASYFYVKEKIRVHGLAYLGLMTTHGKAVLILWPVESIACYY